MQVVSMIITPIENKKYHWKRDIEKFFNRIEYIHTDIYIHILNYINLMLSQLKEERCHVLRNADE